MSMVPPEITRLLGQDRVEEIEREAIREAAQVMSDKSLYGFAIRGPFGQRIDPRTLGPKTRETSSRIHLRG